MSLLGIAAIGSLATGLVSSIFGGAKSASAARKQKRLLQEAQARNEAWYNKNYYQNYLDSTEAQAAIRRVEDTMRRERQQAQAQAAISGGTQESVLAQQANSQKAMGDVVSNLAERADARKAAVDEQYQRNNDSILAGNMAQYQADEAGSAQVMNGGLGLIGKALELYGASTGGAKQS